jgi:hypothetical protein
VLVHGTDRSLPLQLLNASRTKNRVLPDLRSTAARPRIGELARRGEPWGTSEARQLLEHVTETGRGSIYLRLTPERYRTLGRAKASSNCHNRWKQLPSKVPSAYLKWM